MGEKVSLEEGWWDTHSWFTSNENSCGQDEMLMTHTNEEKITAGDDDKQPLDHPNMCSKIQPADENKNNINVSSHHVDDGVVRKRKGKSIVVGEDRMGKRAWNINNGMIRVSAERRRRNIETKLYGELLALLPHLTFKDQKAKILKEAVKTIKSMEETLRGLEQVKLERLHGASQSLCNNTESSGDLLINKSASINLHTISDRSSNSFKTLVSSNVTLSVFGADAVINVCSERIPDLFTTICYIFGKHNMEVVYTEISSDDAKTMYMIRARVRGTVPPEGFPYEEMYNNAVTQIARLVTFQN